MKNRTQLFYDRCIIVMKGSVHTMYHDEEIIKILSEIPKPTVREGPHRLKLKYSLLQKMRKERVPMKSWKKSFAWATCLILFIVVSVWAGQKIHKSFTIDVGDNKSIKMSSDAPDYTKEKAQKQYEEIQKLISGGEYNLLEIKENDYGKTYIYKFILSDGEIVAWGTRKPLDAHEQESISSEEILKLFAQGKVILIEEKELDTGETIYLYKVTRKDGSTLLFGSDNPLEINKKP